MYDRAPRPLTQPSSSTPPALGPGAYHWRQNTSSSAGFAPFSSLSKRQSFLTMSQRVVETPGPGHYQVDCVNSSQIKGGESLRSKSLRFAMSAPETPGPGTYEVSASTPWTKSYVKSISVFSKEMLRERNAAHNGHVFYQRQSTAPSIPFPGLNYGYETTASGQLKPQQLPDRDGTIGPAYYNIFQDESTTGVKYRGISFGSLKSRRMSFKGKEGPGPGEYELQPSCQSASISQSGTANLPRYHELIPYEEAKKDFPGPGKYSLPTQFSSDGDGSDAAANKPAFGSSLKRFGSAVTCSPPSTKYSDPRSAFSCLKRITALSRSPFGQTASRFKESRLALEVPGPGSYNNSDATSISTQALHKSVTVGVMQPVFGSSSMRTAPLAKVDSLSHPGPSDYHIHERPPLFFKPTAAFASRTKRFQTPSNGDTDSPSSVWFGGVQSFFKPQDERRTHAAPVQSSPQVSLPRDTFLVQRDPSNPGPGQYDPDKFISFGMQRQGLICSKQERFKLQHKTHLGPGTYDMSKGMMDTVLRGTHNVTLGNPLVVEDEKPSKAMYNKCLAENTKNVLLTAQ